MRSTSVTRADQGAAEKERQRAAFIVFSGDMDRAIAAFTLANTAAAAGAVVTLYFTFWGLSILRSPATATKGGLMDRLLGCMLPRGLGDLPTSRMNFMGFGPWLFRRRMKKKNHADLAELLEQSRALGVRLVACEASSDVLGLDCSQLIEGVELAGAMAYFGEASRSDVSLFI